MGFVGRNPLYSGGCGYCFLSGVRVAEADGEKPVLGLLERLQGQTIPLMLAY